MSPIEPLRGACVALLVALVPPQEDGWKRVEPGLELVFPADHGAHPGFETEWWYLTGHLEDEAGAAFGFQFTVFRRGLEPGPRGEGSELRASEAYAGHLVLTDVARRETRFAERLRRASPLARATTGELDVRLEDWSLHRAPPGALSSSETLALEAGDPARGFAYSLRLTPEKPLVLHGERGYSRKGADPGNASAYASWTRLAVTGTLRLDGTERTVRGSAWYDHEFGSTVLADGAVGWDWFSLQLADGRDLMAFHLRDAAGNALAPSAGTLVESDGSARPLTAADFRLRPSATWTSPTTRAVYPAGWTLAVPSAGLELVLSPLVPDCELVSTSTDVSYWEGPIAVTGTVPGRGYAEMTGYHGSLAGRF
ncbi:MAG TPA: lipocalin-like domain-containing protein [Planctomycetota bacterium]